MQLTHTVAELRSLLHGWRRADETVALVPTMGYLHAGHLSLVALARSQARRVVTTIFVNPTQFGPSEDLARYPRDQEGDRRKLEAAGTDALFAPSLEEIYPAGFETWVHLEHLPEHLCGLSRPVHFRGVATVCTKLFNIVQPDVAVFGEKDYQQLLVIRRLVRDLNIPVRIVGGPIVREADGLAMSSRNAYLDPDQRRRALAIPESLHRAEQLIHSGVTDAAIVTAAMEALIVASGGRPDYLRLVDVNSLDDVQRIDRPVQATVAAFYGPTRLIDNRLIVP